MRFERTTRLVSATDEAVTFRTRGDQTATLHPIEFLRRFLQHVLPYRFVKLRHYGLLAPGNATAGCWRRGNCSRQRPSQGRRLQSPQAAVTRENYRAFLLRCTGIDVTRCPLCDGLLAPRPLVRPPFKDSS